MNINNEKRNEIFLFILNFSTPQVISYSPKTNQNLSLSLDLFDISKLPSMALRNIDNALPISQERPKKLPKLSKQPEIGVKDENNPVPLPESSVDYVASEDLKPFPDPESSVQVRFSPDSINLFG